MEAVRPQTVLGSRAQKRWEGVRKGEDRAWVSRVAIRRKKPWDEPGCSHGLCEKDRAHWQVSVVSDKWECGVLCTEEAKKGIEWFRGENKGVDLDL